MTPEKLTTLTLSLVLLAVVTCPASRAASVHTADPEVQARSLYDRGSFRQAADLYATLSSGGGEREKHLRARGLCLLRLGDYEAAVADLKAVTDELGPYRERKFPGLGNYQDWQRAQQQYLDANNALARNDCTLAVNMYEVALTIYPQYPQCLHNLAIALGKKGDYQAAAVRSMEAISYRHDDWKFWRTLGFELFKQGRLRSSLAAFQQAMALDPPVPDRAQLIDDVELVKDYLHKRVR